MKILRDYPPNFEDIAAALPDARNYGTIFCYGDTIYNPSGGKVSAPLRAHEAIHSARQGDNPEEWWRKYIADSRFRYDEEVPAHQAEYAAYCEIERDKNRRFRCLVVLSLRLSSSLYGEVVSFAAAKNAIRNRQQVAA